MILACLSKMSRVSLLAACAAILCTNGLTRADVVPVEPADFGASAVVETFEGIAGVQLPLRPLGTSGHWYPTSYLPVPFTMPGGSVFSASGPEVGQVVDWSQQDPNLSMTFGWGLSTHNGSLDPNTPLQSGTSFLTLCGSASASLPPTAVTFTFPTPVQMVGAYVEASKSLLPNLYYLDGVATLTAFDTLGNQIGQTSVVTNGAGWCNFVNPPVWLGALDTWIGLGTADGSYSIASITLQGWYLAADDLMFAPVPEPASAAAALLGLALIVRRR